jgi:hypothetical protein
MRTRPRPRPRRDLVKHISLDGLEVTRLGLGCMGMSAYYYSLPFSARWSRSPLPPLVDGASSAEEPARRFSQAWVR